MSTEPRDKWRIETNDRYAKIVSLVVSLSTGALALPALFLREFLGVPKETALLPSLNCWAFAAWICLGASIVLGLFYSWLSVKWVKLAWGHEIRFLPEPRLNLGLDLLFVGMVVSFLARIGFLVSFFVTSHVVSGSQAVAVGPC
jgi:hypothetical protein